MTSAPPRKKARVDPALRAGVLARIAGDVPVRAWPTLARASRAWAAALQPPLGALGRLISPRMAPWARALEVAPLALLDNLRARGAAWDDARGGAFFPIDAKPAKCARRMYATIVDWMIDVAGEFELGTTPCDQAPR